MKSNFKHQDVEIVSKEILFQSFGKIVRYKIKHKLFSGGYSQVLQREIYQRFNAVTVIPYDPKLDKVVLIEQFRAGALADKNTPWLLELVAGIIDKGKTAEETAYLELKEEAGLDFIKLIPVYNYWSTPGGSSEYITLFCAIVDASKACGIHGLKTEGEDIKVHVVSTKDAFAAVKNGTICNGSSIIALQWLELNLGLI